jgi:hypothetical protein
LTETPPATVLFVLIPYGEELLRGIRAASAQQHGYRDGTGHRDIIRVA